MAEQDDLAPGKKSNERRTAARDILPQKDGPLTIKWMAGDLKHAALSAAGRKLQTMQVWAAEAFMEKIQRERESPGPGDILPPGAIIAIDPVPLSLQDLIAARQLALDLSAMRQRELKPNSKLVLALERRFRQLVIGDVKPKVKPLSSDAQPKRLSAPEQKRIKG